MDVKVRPAIVLDKVSKRYPLYSSPRHRLRDLLLRRSSGEHWALRDVDLKVARGETVGIVGGNGAGKSTLLGLVAGTTAATHGTVAVDGRVAALLELGAGFHPDWTGRQNAEFHMRLRGATRRETLALVDGVEAFADIGDYFDQPLRACSSGMAMRIAFAAAVAIEPDIIVVDEALAVGDASFQHKCFKRLAEFQAHGVTILLVTHRLDLIPQMCGRAILLDGGRIAFDGPPGETVARYVDLLLSAGRGAGAPDPEGLEFRSGSGEAEIAAVRVRDARGAATLSFAAGETASFTVHLRFRDAVERPVLGFALRTVENVVLYAVNSDMLGKTLPAAAAAEELEVRIGCSLRLPAGPVFADFTIASMAEGELRILDARLSMLKLDVRSARSVFGLVDLEAELSVAPQA
jgi:ABC-type polysaccharide/polyol phosphate transport system ATPase subunit